LICSLFEREKGEVTLLQNFLLYLSLYEMPTLFSSSRHKANLETNSTYGFSLIWGKKWRSDHKQKKNVVDWKGKGELGDWTGYEVRARHFQEARAS